MKKIKKYIPLRICQQKNIQLKIKIPVTGLNEKE
jgi:hypothetical protein